MSDFAPKRIALLSVSDRRGLVDFARGLVSMGFELLSTGGTATHLADSGLRIRSVSDFTRFPEVFSGRVKTLHPKIFGGVLFDRSVQQHIDEAAVNGVAPIDVVVVNLYPFEETWKQVQAAPESEAAKSFRALIEKCDIGGPSLLRAAAKNHASVTVLCDPADYDGVLAEMKSSGGVPSPATRRRLAAKVFRRTAAYDAVIASWLTGEAGGGPFPDPLALSWNLGSELRYGENPHQRGAFYADPLAPASSLARFRSIQGKELSYNNLLDADAALFAARRSGGLAIVKHRIPSGIAIGASPAEAFERAWASDPVAGFGGVVALTGPVDADAARTMTARFLEVIVATGVTDEAREIFAKKPNLRVLVVDAETREGSRLEVRGVDGGLLVQEADVVPEPVGTWKVATARAPSESEWKALYFAANAVRAVVSNAIVVCGAESTYGIGGGRTSRVDACRDAVAKAGDRARGAVAASDAFFPFPDGLEVLLDAGVTAVVQPGGSVKDTDVIAAADARGAAMVFSGRRHFRH